MKFEDVKDRFINSHRFERETGMSHVNWVNWQAKGYIPILSQLRIERLTNGELKADLSHVPRDDQ